MGDTKQICRLCLDIVPNGDSEAISETGKEILEILLDLHVRVNDSAVACNRCLVELQECYDFKTNCLDTDNYISSFFVGTNVRVDIKKVFQMQIKNGANVNLENVHICRLCVSLIEDNNAPNYNNDVQDMIRKCLPKVDLSTVYEPIFCQLCLDRIKRLSKFMKTCREVEQKIRNYSQDAADHGVSDKVILQDLLSFEKCHTASEPIKVDCSDLDVKCPKNEDAVSIECEGVHLKDELGNKVDVSGVISGDGYLKRKRPIGQSASDNEADMDNVSKQICRLCLQTIPDGDSEAIDGAKRGILKVLLINIDFGISSEAVACKTCLVKVQDCFDFKSNCLYVDDYKGTFLDKVVQEGVMSNEDIRVENVQLCQLCMSSIENEPLNWTTDSKDAVLFNIMIRKCLPEVTLNAVNEPLICNLCVSNMNIYDDFMEICHQLEQRIKSYRDVAAGLGLEVVLKDMLEYENCHTFSQPISTTTEEECLDAQSYTNFKDCPEKEDIASIKLEEIYIKEETEDAEEMGDNLGGEEMGDTVPSRASDNSGKKGRTKTSHRDMLEVEMQKCVLSPYKTRVINQQLSQKNSGEMLGQRERCAKFKCEICPYRTDMKSSLDTHNLIHMDKSEVLMHKCDNCEYQTKYRSAIIRHMVRHREPKAEKKFKCDKCPYKTNIKSSLRSHNLIHKDRSEVEIHKCDNCEYETKYKSTMVNHMMKHRDPRAERKFKCDKCSYETNFNGDLSRHNKTHRYKSEIYKCDNCEYETKYKKYMIRHMLRHREPKAERKFKCDICPYATKFKSSLCKHHLMHMEKSEVKLYKCDNCEYETRYKSNMIPHMVKHRDPRAERKFKCDKCPYETDFKGNLCKHTVTHKNKS